MEVVTSVFVFCLSLAGVLLAYLIGRIDGHKVSFTQGFDAGFRLGKAFQAAEALDRKECPGCSGKGVRDVLANRGEEGCEPASVECWTCRGRKTVPMDRDQRVLAGRRMREDRITRGITIAGEAARLNISVTELSRLERGDEL